VDEHNDTLEDETKRGEEDISELITRELEKGLLPNICIYDEDSETSMTLRTRDNGGVKSNGGVNGRVNGGKATARGVSMMRLGGVMWWGHQQDAESASWDDMQIYGRSCIDPVPRLSCLDTRRG